jgi:hypothetical protein
VVTKQVIERHLIRRLPLIFSPLIMMDFSDEEISFIAAEPNSVVLRREHLETQQKMLSEGQQAFKKAMGRAI